MKASSIIKTTKKMVNIVIRLVGKKLLNFTLIFVFQVGMSP